MYTAFKQEILAFRCLEGFWSGNGGEYDKSIEYSGFPE